MTKDERKRIGRRLKAARAGRGMDQIAVAKKAKVAVGTVQTIEWGTRETRDSNIEKVAGVFGLTLKDLLRDEQVVPEADPLFVGLKREDLRIAHLYHDAETPLRQFIHEALTTEIADDVLALARRIAKLPPEMRTTITDLTREAEGRPENERRATGSMHGVEKVASNKL